MESSAYVTTMVYQRKLGTIMARLSADALGELSYDMRQTRRAFRFFVIALCQEYCFISILENHEAVSPLVLSTEDHACLLPN